MRTPEEMEYLDERDWQAQQKADAEAQEYRLTEILRRVAEGVIVSREDVIVLCQGCGVDKRNVL